MCAGWCGAGVERQGWISDAPTQSRVRGSYVYVGSKLCGAQPITRPTDHRKATAVCSVGATCRQIMCKKSRKRRSCTAKAAACHMLSVGTQQHAQHSSAAALALLTDRRRASPPIASSVTVPSVAHALSRPLLLRPAVPIPPASGAGRCDNLCAPTAQLCFLPLGWPLGEGEGEGRRSLPASWRRRRSQRRRGQTELAASGAGVRSLVRAVLPRPQSRGCTSVPLLRPSRWARAARARTM